MKVLLINGSAKPRGCTYTALNEVASTLNDEGIETEIVYLGINPIRDCTGCGGCRQNHRCIYKDDIVNSLIDKAELADGFVFGSPVYYSHPSGRILDALDRMFYANKKAFKHKPAFVVVSARRAGTTASIEVLNKYLSISEMPIVSGSYWTMVHGYEPQDVLKDEEGLQTMRNAARNLAWLIRAIDIAKKNGISISDNEYTKHTNFIE